MSEHRGASEYALEILPAGWEALRNIPREESPRAFVAMSFGGEMLRVYKSAIEPAIGDAGYDPLCVIFDEFTGDIIDRILAGIRESRFIVADFTEEKKGVYFEAGYALGLGIPVIWTVRKDDLKNLHFDTSHFNHIVWTSPEELRDRLHNRIRAVIGIGPLLRGMLGKLPEQT